jgi:colicin import membrane protein
MTSPTFNNGNGYSGKDPNFYNMILLSLVVHFLVITIVLVSLPSTSRHLTFGPVYSVSLVSSDVVLSRNQESSFIKEMETSGKAATSVIYKKEINRLAATPVKKEETNKLNIEKAINAIRQKERTAPETSAAAGPAGRSNVPAGKKMPGAEVAAQYINVVWSKIQKNWTLPPTLMPKENIETIIAVRIARSGGLEQVNFEKRSGNRYFDDAALKAIKKSSPFPTFPNRMTDDNIEIGIRFHPSQFRSK